MISKFTQKILSKLNDVASNNFKPKDNDFTNDQGLIMCGTCKKPLQTFIDGASIKLFVPCDCLVSSWENSKRLQENKDSDNLKNDIIKKAFHDEKLRKVTFESVRSLSAPQLDIKSYADNFVEFKQKGVGKLIFGDIGSGKSFAAISLANRLIDCGFSVKYSSLSRLYCSFNSSNFDSLLDYLKSFDLLIIDDFLDGSETNGFLSAVHQIINSRVESSLPIVIVTNLLMSHMKNHTNIPSAQIFSKLFKVCLPSKFSK